MRENAFLRTKKIVLVALVSALLFVGKLALAFLPQIEVVTLFIVAFTYVFGLSITFPATLLFVWADTTMYAFAPWVVSYLIYWPSIAIVTHLMKSLLEKNTVAFGVIITGIMTLSFGFLTSFVDTLFYSDLGKMLEFFIALYLRGIYFYIVHIISNIIIMTVLIQPLTKILKMVKRRYLLEET